MKEDLWETFKIWFFEGIGLIVVGVATLHIGLNADYQILAPIGILITILGVLFIVLPSNETRGEYLE